MLLALGRELTLPIVRNAPVEKIPAAIGSLHGISLPRGLPRLPVASPECGANVNLLLRFASETRAIPGDIAECGVYTGRTLIPLALHVRHRRIPKGVLGFDSFEGFDARDVRAELTASGADGRDEKLRKFTNASWEALCAKIRRLDLESTILLTKGFFREALPRFGERKFSFVHLDCDLYQAYADCLAFFYPRLSKGAVVLVDEYNDPQWPGCNNAVDEFLKDKPERLLMAESDNYQKWYFRRL